jgi:hypothetical protein
MPSLLYLGLRPRPCLYLTRFPSVPPSDPPHVLLALCDNGDRIWQPRRDWWRPVMLDKRHRLEPALWDLCCDYLSGDRVMARPIVWWFWRALLALDRLDTEALVCLHRHGWLPADEGALLRWRDVRWPVREPREPRRPVKKGS